MSSPVRRHDVAIIGGGMAGLTLALQLRCSIPELDLVVLERKVPPFPEAVHKIGESTVELGSHYLAHTLDLRAHLDRVQLRKFGLRFFFGAGAGPLHQADELGVSAPFETPTWQVDRGRLENELWRRAEAAGVTLMSGTRVIGLDVGDPKILRAEQNGAKTAIEARWVVDAAGRTSPLKRRLRLAQANTHDVNAAWFRVSGELRVDDWSTDPAWRERTKGRPRWLSTNQLMGPGYWVWIIPLASGATSIGIVAEARQHPLETFNTRDSARRWLARHEPRLAVALDDHADLDFGFLRHFSHGCSQLFSADRWALTGESGVFVDPLYSPGTDFIAIGNTFITELIERDRRGEDISLSSRGADAIYKSLYSNTLSVYQGHYPGFGDSRGMALKTSWDYSFYWSMTALLFFNEALLRPIDDAALRNSLLSAVGLNARMQKRFRALPHSELRTAPAGRFFDQQQVPIMGRLNSGLGRARDDGALADRLQANLLGLQQLADVITRRLDAPHRAPDAMERELLGGFVDLLIA